MNNYLKTIDNIKVPVSKEVYSQINSIQNRTNYVTRRLKECGLIYYESYSYENNTGESRIKDRLALSTETVIKEELYNALATLSIDDQLLLYKLYAMNSSLRGALLKNLDYPTKVKRHKEVLLKKLAILLKEYEEDFFDSITR